MSGVSLVRSWRASVAAGVTAALVGALGLVAISASPATAAATLTVTTTGTDATVLAGAGGSATVHAANSGDVDLFNAVLVATLPPGVAYEAGSTTPAPPDPQSPGEPEVREVRPDPADPTTFFQVLVWSNVADLPVGARTELSFRFTPDAARYPVGAVVPIGVAAAGSGDLRRVPQVVAAAGGLTWTDATATAAGTGSVQVSPLRLTKSEPSPESELMRGGAGTLYTLTVTGAPSGATEAVTVTDYLPAALTYDGCVSVTGTTCAAAGGAGTVVVDPPGRPAGTYTQIVFTLGTVPAGTTRVITYRANAGLTGVDGQSNRQQPGADGARNATNTAVLHGGRYLGVVADGSPTEVTGVTASATVHIQDLSLVKTREFGQFFAGTVGFYRLDVRTSQYVTGDALTLVDTLPDGMCPVLPAGASVAGTWPVDCPAPGTRTETVEGTSAVGARVNADGTITVTMSLPALGASTDHVVRYPVYMRAVYSDGRPTATGDAFTNAAVLTGTTSPVAGTGETGDVALVENPSGAGVGTDVTTLVKRSWPNTDRTLITGTATCPGVDSTDWSITDGPNARLGDLLCFQVDVQLAAGAATRDGVISDSVPLGTGLVGYAVSRSDGVTVTQDGTADGGVWLLGDLAGDGHRYAAAGARVVLVVLARVLRVDTSDAQVRGNLAKLRYRDESGRVLSARANATFTLAPPVPLALTKTVVTAATPGGGTSAVAREGETVQYTLGVTHQGTDAAETGYPLDAVTVWDALPAAFACTDLVAATLPAGATCGAGTSPATAGRTVLTFTLTGAALGADGMLTAGEAIAVTFGLTLPVGLSVDSSHVNQASVVAASALTTDGTPDGMALATFFPTGSLDDRDTALWNAPAANSSAEVHLPGVGVSKAVTATGLTQTNNSFVAAGATPAQATIGETVSWRYSVTVPAHTTVFSGVLRDVLGAGLALSPTVPPTATVPAGLSVDTPASCASAPVPAPGHVALCPDGTLYLPAVWDDETDASQTFTVQVTGVVQNTTDGSTLVAHGANLVDTATFTSKDTADSPGTTVRGSAQATVVAVVPNPTLQKARTNSTGSNTVSGDVAGGETVYFRLRATNASGRPPTHDAVVTDCVPAGLTLGALSPPAGTTAASEPGTGTGTGGNGCASGATKLTWTIGTLAPTGNYTTLVYPATVTAQPVGASTYTNGARLTTSTLPNGVNDAATGERVLTATASVTVTVGGAAIATKVADRATAVPGESITWTVRVSLPAGIEFPDLAVLDRLPAGLGAPTGLVVVCDAGWASVPCPAAVALTPTGTAPSTVGWRFDGVTAAPAVRTVTLTYVTAVLPAGPLVAGGLPANSALARWNATALLPVTASTSEFARGQATGTSAVVLVQEPSPRLTKAVDDATPEPGQTVTYTVGVHNDRVQNSTVGSTTYNRYGVTAYNVVAVDTVPVGVVPLADDDQLPAATGDVVGGGTWDATARTLTWSPGDLAWSATAVVTHSYTAILAASSSLTGETLTNTVRLTAWDSLSTGGRAYRPTAGAAPRATASVTPQFPRVTTAKTLGVANPVYADQQVPYTLTFTNAGTGTAASFDATDTLPAGWTYVTGSGTVAVRSGAASALADPALTGGTGGTTVARWTNLGGATLALAGGQTVVVTYLAAPTALTAGRFGSSVAHTNSAVAASVRDGAGGTAYDAGDGSYAGPAATATARVHSADLALTKTPVGAFVAGATATWTVTVTNGGPDPAVGVVVTDTPTLPAGANVTAAGGSGWTCTPLDPAAGLSGGFTCVRTTGTDTLASGSSWSFPVSIALPADLATTGTGAARAVNTAAVAARTHDPVATNNSATSNVPILARADLGLAKSGPATVVPGTPVTWTLTATNHGPSLSRAPITLVDTVPAGMSGLTATSSDASCVVGPPATDGTTPITCTTSGDLAPNGTVVVTLTGTLDAAAQGPSLVNSARVSGTTPEDGTGGTGTWPNTATVASSVAPDDALTVLKDLVGTELVAGTPATYTLTVHNAGPSVSRGVTVSDPLPDALTFVPGSVVGTGWSCSALAGPSGALTCTYMPVLGVDASTSFTFAVQVASSTTGVVTNTATVGSSITPGQDSDEAAPGVRVRTDLALTKALTATAPGGSVADPVFAGTATSFTLVVTNNGPSDVGASTTTPITVTDTLPTGLTLASLVTGCTTAPDATDHQVVTCTRTTGLVAGGTWTLTLPVDVAPDTDPATVTNRAVVAGPDDTDPTNDSATAPVVVAAQAALTLTKTAAPLVVTAGTTVTYTLTVGNDGPSDARQVVVSDPLAAELTLISATSGQGTCAGTAPVTCELGTVPAGAGATITVVARVATWALDASTTTNTATATSTTPRPDDASSVSASATITVAASADLTLVKSPESQGVRAGENATFALAVTNAGPSDAAAPVTVTDTLPAGMTFVSSTGPWACVPAPTDPQQVACTLVAGDPALPVGLAAGTSAPTLGLVTRVSPAQTAGTLTNDARVDSPTPDPVEGNDADTADVVVATFADLGLTKTHLDSFVAGGPGTYRLTVTNGGPSDSVADAASPITVTDTLPAGVTFTPGGDGTLTSGGFTCVAGPDDTTGPAPRPTVVCTRPTTLDAAATAVVDLPVTLASGLTGSITNDALVVPGRTAQPAPDTLPDAAQDVAPVGALAALTLTKTATPDPVTAGQDVTYTLAVGNTGPSDARDVVLTDTLPGTLTPLSATWPAHPDACVLTGQDVTCDLGTVVAAAGPTVTVTVVARVAADVLADATITNTALVVTSTPDLSGQPGSAHDDAAVTVAALADLTLTKTVVTVPTAGEGGRFRFLVTNIGPSDAQALTVSDTLPAPLTYAGNVTAQDGSTWTCSLAPTDPAAVTCALTSGTPAGALAAGGSTWFELDVHAPSDLTAGTTNSAQVSSPTPDPDLENNASSVDVSVRTRADLAVTKSHTGPVRVGDPLTFDLVVTNAGPSDALDVVLTDTVPSGLDVTGVRSDDPAWTCTAGAPGDTGTPVTCLAAGLVEGGTAGTVHVDVVVLPEAYPGVTNEAQVTAATPEDDATLGDNVASDEVVVPASVTLALVKTMPGPFQVGSDGAVTLTVSNSGPTPDPGPVTLTDPMPAGLRLVSATAPEGTTCVVAPTLLTCTIAAGLAVGESVTVTARVLVGSAAYPSVSNAATATSVSAGPDGTAAAAADDATTVVLAAPLAVTGVNAAVGALLVALLLLAGFALLTTSRRARRG